MDGWVVLGYLNGGDEIWFFVWIFYWLFKCEYRMGFFNILVILFMG